MASILGLNMYGLCENGAQMGTVFNKNGPLKGMLSNLQHQLFQIGWYNSKKVLFCNIITFGLQRVNISKAGPIKKKTKYFIAYTVFWKYVNGQLAIWKGCFHLPLSRGIHIAKKRGINSVPFKRNYQSNTRLWFFVVWFRGLINFE